jgi:transposase InsO family protein
MQVFGLPGYFIRNGKAASRLLGAEPQGEAERRRDAVARWRRAVADGLTTQKAAKAVGVARATLYRWEKDAEPKSRRPHKPRRPQWSRELALAVEGLRADNPMWGKRKLAILLRREGLTASVSTVGRILAGLVKRGAVTPVPQLRRRPAAKRFRFTAGERYARRLPKGRKAKLPGELVQIDTLFVNVRPDVAIKHFTAYDPVAKWTVGRVAGKASAVSASALLDKLIAEAPFPIRGIQVDGGSEFRAEFETLCKTRGLELFVLPPKRPDLNGCVERAQSTWRYEFYGCYDLPHRLDKLQPFVDAFAHRFNHHRPHDALGGLTPAEYLKASSGVDPPQSHMY